jgi:hypothetical protein
METILFACLFQESRTQHQAPIVLNITASRHVGLPGLYDFEDLVLCAASSNEYQRRILLDLPVIPIEKASLTLCPNPIASVCLQLICSTRATEFFSVPLSLPYQAILYLLSIEDLPVEEQAILQSLVQLINSKPAEYPEGRLYDLLALTNLSALSPAVVLPILSELKVRCGYREAAIVEGYRNYMTRNLKPDQKRYKVRDLISEMIKTGKVLEGFQRGYKRMLEDERAKIVDQRLRSVLFSLAMFESDVIPCFPSSCE